MHDAILRLDSGKETLSTPDESGAGTGCDVEASTFPQISATARTSPLAGFFYGIGSLVVLTGACYFARSVILPVALAWIASMALKPAVSWLRGRHIPSWLAALLVLAAIVLPVGLTVSTLSHPAIEWVRDAPDNIVRLKERFEQILRPAHRLTQAAASVAAIGNVRENNVLPTQVELNDGRATRAVFSWAGGMLVSIAEFTVLLFFLLSAGDALLLKLVRVVPGLHDSGRVVEVSTEVQRNLSTYLFTVSIVNIAFGVLVAGTFWVTGMAHAAMWGMVAAGLNFIPYYGAIIGMAAVTMSGLLAFDSVGKGLAPAAIYFAIHLVEANAVTPLLLGRRFMLNPFIILLMLMFLTWLWGVPGAFLAVPLLVSAKVVCDRVSVLLPVSELLAR